MGVGGHKGFSLLGLLIAISVGFFVVLAVTALLQFQMKETESLRGKLELNQTQMELQRAFLNPAICLRNFRTLIFNETQFSSAYSVPMAELFVRTTPDEKILENGQSLRGQARSRVESIAASNFRKISVNKYKLDINVLVQSTFAGTLEGKIRLIRVHVETDPASPANAKVITSCASNSAPPMNRVCRTITVIAPGIGVARAECAASEELTGGGGECLTSSGTPMNTTVNPMDYSFLHVNMPRETAGRWGWEADCFSRVGGSNSQAKSFAICCR